METDKEKQEEIWIAKTWYENEKEWYEKTWHQERWKATKGRVDETDFEDTRRCLLNSYHSYVQTHAGYLIALIIGFLAIIATFESFFKTLVGIGFFIFLILALFGTSVFMALRIVYWTYYANVTLTITFGHTIQLFNDYNSSIDLPYKEKAPNTAIIQLAIFQGISKAKKEKKSLSCLQIWAVRASREH